MTKYLILEDVTSGEPVQIGRLGDTDVVGIGRDPEGGGIAVDNTAISRTHGIFSRHQRHWFYRDNGSTNGSWLNGNPVKQGQIRIVRPGDVVQLADTAIQLRHEPAGTVSRIDEVEGIANVGGRSLFVFSRGQFVNEFPIKEYGRTLAIGGSSADLELEGDLYEDPSLVVERKGTAVVAYSVAQEACVFVNSKEIEDCLNIADGDEIVISYYTVLYNDPTARKSRGERHETAQAEESAQPSTTQSSLPPPQQPEESGTLRGWTGLEKDESSVTGHSPLRNFGHLDPLDDSAVQTYSMDTKQLGDASQNIAYNTPRSSRPSIYDTGSTKDFSYSSLEDRIILLVIFFVLVALMVLVAVFALT